MSTTVARLVAIAVLAATPCEARAQPADTTRVSTQPLLTADDAKVGAAFVFGTIAAFPLDSRFAKHLQGAPQTNQLFKRLSFAVENVAIPGAFLIGGTLYGVGRLAGNERMADLGLHGSEAIVIGLVATSAIKFAVGRARPYVGEGPNHFEPFRGIGNEDFRSFPSGHTLIGFAAAAAVVEETRIWWPNSVWYIGPLMYGGAAAIGLSRMYDNKHWLSDVIMGAAFGTFSGRKVVRYHHSHPGNRLDEWLLGVSGVPGAHGLQWRLFVAPVRR